MWVIPIIVLGGALLYWKVLAVAGDAAGAAYKRSQEKGRQTLQLWAEAAARCGLRVEESFLSPPALRARQGEMRVSIESHSPDGDPIWTRIEVTLPGPLSLEDFELRRKSGGLLEWSHDLEIGDQAFDARFAVQGSAPLVRSLLDADMRRLLMRAHAAVPFEISSGALRAPVADPQVPRALPLLIEIGQRFGQRGDMIDRLVRNARGDPEAGVRLQNLLLLTREFAGLARTAEVLRDACSDPSSEIRLRAALELGAEGYEILLQLAGSGVTLEDATMAQVVASLAWKLPVERLWQILDRTLSGGRSRTAHACLEALAASGDPAAVEALAKALGRQSGELAAAAARALGTTGSAAAEPWLVAALEREPDVRLAAAEALGPLGSTAAVLPLKEAAERAWADRGFQRAVRQAVAEIQSRLEGATPGQLSLAPPEDGRLSLAPPADGRLSLAQAEAGELSLAPPAGERLSPTADPDE